ncbi:hypothetical protein [Streptomyces sp. NPDC056707]|uniref:hypothetical protein n=1 Tax=Streptomyces sp. NPDC056707 TaxID=3345919 RepID=UPI0036A2FA6F
MIIVYTPKGGDPEHHDARSLLSSEASIVARTIDMKWPAVKEGLREEDLDAMRAVVWILKKRHQANLRYGDFDPGVDDMVTRYDKGEVEEWVKSGFGVSAADPEITPEQIAYALREVPDAAADPDHARAYIEKLQAEAEAEGKDPEPVEAAEAVPELTTSATSTSATSEPSTSDSSPTSSTSDPTLSTS